jgi:hypothetical protein
VEIVVGPVATTLLDILVDVKVEVEKVVVVIASVEVVVVVGVSVGGGGGGVEATNGEKGDGDEGEVPLSA